MYIPDPIERMEASAERWADEYIKGSKFLCGCGLWCDLDRAETLIPNPYSIPTCPDCCKKYYEGLERENNNES